MVTGYNFQIIWASAWDFQQCGMCDQQRLRPACAYVQSDQSLCKSPEYSLTVKLLRELQLKRRLHRLIWIWVYTCQNTTLLGITCGGPFEFGTFYLWFLKIIWTILSLLNLSVWLDKGIRLNKRVNLVSWGGGTFGKWDKTRNFFISWFTGKKIRLRVKGMKKKRKKLWKWPVDWSFSKLFFFFFFFFRTFFFFLISPEKNPVKLVS